MAEGQHDILSTAVVSKQAKVVGSTTLSSTRYYMSHPKEAWKFKLWSEAMLRGATVGNPEYKGRASSPSKTTSAKKTRRRRRRRKKSHASKT